MLSLSMIELTFCCGLAGLGDAAAGICVGSAAAAMANPANSKRSRRVSDGLGVNRLALSFAPRLVIHVLQNHQTGRIRSVQTKFPQPGCAETELSVCSSNPSTGEGLARSVATNPHAAASDNHRPGIARFPVT